MVQLSYIDNTLQGASEMIKKTNLFQFEVGKIKVRMRSPGKFNPFVIGEKSDVLLKKYRS